MTKAERKYLARVADFVRGGEYDGMTTNKRFPKYIADRLVAKGLLDWAVMEHADRPSRKPRAAYFPTPLGLSALVPRAAADGGDP